MLTSHSLARDGWSALSVWGLVGAVVAALLGALTHASWWAAALFAIPLSLVYGFVAASAYYVCRTQPSPRQYALQTVVTYGSSALLSGLLLVLMGQGWNSLAGNLLLVSGVPGVASGELLHLSTEAWLIVALLGSGLYLGALLVQDVFLTNEALRQTQERETQSRLQAREAELQMLRAQINPHFLFNSLNSISALTTLDANAARGMALELAAFYRATLQHMTQDRIRLAQEVVLCQHYLGIERMRYGERLQIRFEVSEEAERALIPPMLVQPGVENAVKHGISRCAEGGTLTVCGWRTGPWLYLTLTNPLDTEQPPAQGTGTGLSNLRQRLAAVYGERARVSVRSEGAVFTLELTLPYETDGMMGATKEQAP